MYRIQPGGGSEIRVLALSNFGNSATVLGTFFTIGFILANRDEGNRLSALGRRERTAATMLPASGLAPTKNLLIMNASTDPLIERFLVLCSFDLRLRGAIAEVKVDAHADGMIALILAAPNQSLWLSHFMSEIASFLCQLGHFKAIVIQTNNYCLPFEMNDLLRDFPEIMHKELAHDRNYLLQVKAMRGNQKFEALANYSTRSHHVFLISTDGRYLEARLQRDSPATITPEQMVGQPIAAFIGTTGADCLMQHLREVYEQGGEREIEYPVIHPNGEARTYQGTLIAVSGSETCILLSQRVTPSVRSRSLAAPP